MANKLYLDNKDHDVAYEPSESEDEYSEEEKEILKEIRQRNKKKSDSKKEVLAFDDNSDEQEDDEGDDDDDDDIIGDSDIERGDEDDRIPDSKAWGKQRRAYYNTDFVDQDYSAYNEKEEEQAQQEEEEAKSIQLRLAKQLDENDFMLDVPAGAASADEDEEKKTLDEEEIKLKTDLSGLSEREKQQLFEKDSPEFAGLVSDFQTQLLESQSLLNPIMEFATERKLNLPIFKFVQARNNLILTYCSNVAIYLLFKAKRIPIKYHPIIKRLAQLRKLLIQLQEKYENVVRPQLENLLEKIQSGEEVEIVVKPVEKKPSKKLRMMKGYVDEVRQSDGEDGEEEEEEEELFKVPGKGIASSDEEDGADDKEDEDEEGDVAERRGITYQIAKNKGLTAHRKKELRNPRVKHRSKFRKALIRRKGAVRTVRTETQRYGGEMSGIKATVKKGIKIKS